MAYQFHAHVIIKGKIECVSGLHIGGTEEGYEIGGMDNPVLKDSITKLPYIPGSSIKGKMRSMTEWRQGVVGQEKRESEKGSVHTCTDPTCKVCRIFGTSAAQSEEKQAKEMGPTRLIVRDAFLSKETKNDPQYFEGGAFKTEVKTENSLNRITSRANPRPMERVPPGALFDFEMLYGIYDMGDQGSQDIENLDELAVALDMFEAGVLGGGGSRGSGQIKIKDPEVWLKRLEDYQASNLAGQKIEIPPEDEYTLPNLLKEVQKQLHVSEKPSVSSASEE